MDRGNQRVELYPKILRLYPKYFPSLPVPKIFDDAFFFETKTTTKQRKFVQKQRKYSKFSPAAGFQFPRILLNIVFSTIKLKQNKSPQGRKKIGAKNRPKGENFGYSEK